MFRRLAARLPISVAASTRCYTPSAELKTLYASDFDKAEYPANIVPSDSVLFAKFLYKAVEPNTKFDTISKDFQTIAAAVPRLPVFWERTCRVEDVAEFKGLSAPTVFTLHWMQSNGMLDLLPDVMEVYETYVNAKLKRLVAKIYTSPGKTEDKALLEAAKKVATETAKERKELAGLTLTFKVLVDRTMVEGFAVDVQGIYINHAKGKQVEGRRAETSDYSSLPLPRLPRTTWEDNIETEVLRKYLDHLALYDEEEVKHGV